MGGFAASRGELTTSAAPGWLPLDVGDTFLTQRHRAALPPAHRAGLPPGPRP